MTGTTDLTRRLLAAWHALGESRARDERGDVPGWVMITVLTVGLALTIFGIAEGSLSGMLNAALGMVTP